ncbi:hypothetical protein, partial [Halobacillus litoralis]|uniref:hypothetical protein n=1 Tax=Halobacillus litoralis TaxID=45668 RepID=UPI001F42AC30
IFLTKLAEAVPAASIHRQAIRENQQQPLTTSLDRKRSFSVATIHTGRFFTFSSACIVLCTDTFEKPYKESSDVFPAERAVKAGPISSSFQLEKLQNGIKKQPG